MPDSTEKFTVILTHEDIAAISNELSRLTGGDATKIAQELLAGLIVSNIRNGG